MIFPRFFVQRQKGNLRKKETLRIILNDRFLNIFVYLWIEIILFKSFVCIIRHQRIPTLQPTLQNIAFPGLRWFHSIHQLGIGWFPFGSAKNTAAKNKRYAYLPTFFYCSLGFPISWSLNTGLSIFFSNINVCNTLFNWKFIYK